MKRRLFRLPTILVIISLVLAACGPDPEPTRTPAPTDAAPEVTSTESAAEELAAAPVEESTLEGTVTLWHPWEEDESESLDEVVAAFQVRNPDVDVEVLYIALDDLREEYEIATALGSGPTVLIGAADWGPGLFEAELVGDLSGLTDAAFLASINQAALGAVRYGGALVGLPQSVEGVVMYRNRDIIGEAPTTFEELVAAAQEATTDDVVGANLERGFFFSGAHLNGVGGLLMDDDGNPLFNDDKGVEWLNLLNSFSEAGPTEYYTDNDTALFQEGKAGIIIDSTWNAASLAEAIGADRLAIDPWPLPMSGYVQIENIYLNANAEGTDRDAAWAFMKFFLSAEAQATLADTTKAGHIPAAIGVEVADPLLAQAAEALAGGTTFPVIPEMSAYWEPMETSLQSVFDEGADPAAALSQAYNSIVAAVAEVRGETPPEEVSAGEITIWHAWEEQEVESLNEVLAAFQVKNPDAQFELRYVPFDDLRDEYEAAAASDGGPSLLIGDAGWGPGLFDAGLVADVRGFTNTPFLATISEVALDAVKYRGALIGLPETIWGVVMFRNEEIIPYALATFEELVTAAQAATQGDIVGANLERGFFFSGAHLEGIGGALMDANGDPLFNDEMGVEWLNLLSSFSDAGPTEYYTDNDVNLFKASKVGIIIGSTLDTAGLAEAVGADRLVIDPWPAFGEEGRLSGYVQAESIYLNANLEGDGQTAAWSFMEFLLSPEAQAMLADPTKAGHVPVISELEVGDPHMMQAMEALSGGTAFPVIPEMDAYWLPMGTALQSVFGEGTDPAEALQIAYEAIIAAIEEIRGGQ